MVFSECPGSKLIKQPTPEEVKCPFCGNEVEIWTDEARTRCSGCGNVVTREMAQSCLDWCPHAEECVGKERLNEYRLSRGENKIHSG